MRKIRHKNGYFPQITEATAWFYEGTMIREYYIEESNGVQYFVYLDGERVLNKFPHDTQKSLDSGYYVEFD